MDRLLRWGKIESIGWLERSAVGRQPVSGEGVARGGGAMAVWSGAISDDGAVRLRAGHRHDRSRQDAAGHPCRAAQLDAVRRPRSLLRRLVGWSKHAALASHAAPARLASGRRNPALHRRRGNAVRFTCAETPSATSRAPGRLDARSRLCLLPGGTRAVGASSSGPGVGLMALTGKVPGR